MFTKSRTAGARWALPLVITLLVSACSPPTETEPKGPTFAGTITLWGSARLAGHPGGLDVTWLEERTQAYAAAHPGVTVQVKTFDTGAALEQALLTGAEKPDLAFGRALPTLGEQLAALPLPAELAADHADGALAPFRRGEMLVGLPVLLDLQVLALNEQAFAAQGLSLPGDGRWTDGEFEDRLQKLSGNERYALGFSHAPGYHHWWSLADGLFTPNGDIAAGAEAGLSRLAAWRMAGQLAPDIATLTTEAAYQRFAAGQIAVLPVSAWAIPLLRSEPFKAAFAVAGFPGDAAHGYAYGFMALAGPHSPEKLRAMADLAIFMAAPDQQVRLARKTGLMPARRSAPNPFEGDEQMTRAFLLAGSFQALPAGPAWDASQQAIADELLLALYGGKAPAEALHAARTHLETATTPAK